MMLKMGKSIGPIMQTATFFGEVHGGQLHVRQPLSAFEGKQVVVTLVASEGGHAQPNAGPRALAEAEILEDTGRIRMPLKGARQLAVRIERRGRLEPMAHNLDEG